MTKWASADHLRVIFQKCPNCITGRVFWGDEPKWLKVTGVRGSCAMCGREWYTADLLSAEEDAERLREAAAEEAKTKKALERECSMCGAPFVWQRQPGKAGRPRTRCERCYAKRVLGAAA